MYDFESWGNHIIVIFPILAALTILQIIATWLIYKKAGQPGWASIIPFYNFYVLLKIVGKPD